MTRFVVLSDTHNKHHEVKLPKGDILIHCGDFTYGGCEYEAFDFIVNWVAEIERNYKKKCQAMLN